MCKSSESLSLGHLYFLGGKKKNPSWSSVNQKKESKKMMTGDSRSKGSHKYFVGKLLGY